MKDNPQFDGKDPGFQGAGSSVSGREMIIIDPAGVIVFSTIPIDEIREGFNILLAGNLAPRLRYLLKERAFQGIPFEVSVDELDFPDQTLLGAPFTGLEALPLFGPSGQVASVAINIIFEKKDESSQSQGEIPEMEKLNKTISRLHSEISLLDKELECFVYSVSHDLKSPILTIEGMAGIALSMADGKLPEEGLSLLKRIIFNSEKMTSMINDILELSRIGRFHLREEHLNVMTIARQTASCMEGKNKYGTIRTTFSGNDAITSFSRVRLAQVFKSLLDNGIKFLHDTPQGAINVDIQSIEGMVQVCIKDNGPGIHSRSFDEIFLPFRRLPNAKDLPGNGMGLAIARAIVRKKGGEMWVKSEPGNGAEFWFTIPGDNATPRS